MYICIYMYLWTSHDTLIHWDMLEYNGSGIAPSGELSKNFGEPVLNSNDLPSGHD